MDSITTLLGVALGALLIIFYSQTGKKRSRAPLPPGPKGLPLLGNIADLPQSQPWTTFAKLGDKYGERLF